MAGTIGKYEVIRKLGEGAMGEVFLARDTTLGREVALKALRGNVGELEARERFFREAQAAGRLTHPHAVTVHDFGEEEGRLYLAMEYVPGEDLSTLLKAGGLHTGELLDILAQVAEALGAAHAMGIVHRDVKPSNIRVQRLGGRPHAKLMDFGIARLGGSDYTGTGVVLGTFGYMAPEYLQSGHADARVDLFALGVILHEALTGRNPFHGDTTGTLIYRILHEDPPRLPPERLAGISASLQQVLDKVLDKDPQRRMSSAAELAECLRAAREPAWVWQGGGLPTVRSTRAEVAALALPPAAQTSDGRRVWPWLVAGLLVGGLGMGAWAFRPRPHAASQAPAAAETPVPSLAGTPPEALSPPNLREVPVERPRPDPPAGLRKPPIPRGPRSLDEGEAWLDRDPAAALACFDRHLAEDPSSERARALKLVALHALGRKEELRMGLMDLRRLGIPPRALAAKVPRFRQMLGQAVAEGSLPLPKPPKDPSALGAPEGRRPRPPRLNLR